MKNQRKSHAFSLIEIAVVVLIIGLIVAGIAQADRLISKAALTSARSMTKGSSAATTKGLVLWLETTNEASFVGSEAKGDQTVSGWFDITPTSGERAKNTTATGSAKPTYVAKAVGGLPALRFDGVDDMFSFTASSAPIPPANSPYTIFYVAKNSASSGAAGNLLKAGNATFGYDTASRIISDNSGGGGIINPLVTSATGTWHIVAFAYDGSTSTTSSNRLFVDGAKQTVTSITGAGSPAVRTNGTTVTIGGTTPFFKGDLAELIVYNKSLKDAEIAEINTYLSKKWKLGASGSSAAPVNTCNVTGTGVTATTVAVGTGSLTCASGFTGTASYDCPSNGGNITATGCSTTTCTVSGTGINAGTTVAFGATSVACNASGYTGTATFSSCNGAAITGATGCTLANTACTGGTIANSGGYNIHTFTSSGTLTCTSTKTVEYLIVAGGGGGGDRGGGGAGGMLNGTGFSLSSGSYTITVGNGGTGVSANSSTGSTSGQNSSAIGFTATGGGAGGGGAFVDGLNGGSGGGSTVNVGVGGSGTSGQGNNGGGAYTFGGTNGACYAGGGGGGKGSAGTQSTGSCLGGLGGAGLANSITGSSVTYAVGGYGCGVMSGAQACSRSDGGNASNGTGNGGDAMIGTNNPGGNGGSGIVVIRYVYP